MHNAVFPDPSLTGVNTIDHLSNMNDYSGLLHSLKRNTDSHLNTLSRNINSPIGDANWHANESHKSRAEPEKKRSRNIGSKSKRLLIESQEALDLKYTWEELQDMLFPPTQPSTVTIDDQEFEEYEVIN